MPEILEKANRWGLAAFLILASSDFYGFKRKIYKNYSMKKNVCAINSSSFLP